MTFAPAQILKAELMNLITGKIDELVGVANGIPNIDAATKENALEIAALKDAEVDISQDKFDKIPESELDPTKTYYIYE